MILITEFMDAGSVRMMESSHPTLYDPDLADHPDDILDRLPGVVALIVRNRTQVTAELLAAAHDLGIVGRLGVGLDNIDLEACVARGVEVIPATGANARSVAEYVITCAFMLLRNAYSARSELLAGHWPRENCSLGREAGGHRLGLVGFGQTARETARLARGLDMEVIALDPFPSDASPAWDGIRPAPLDRLLGRSDVVSLHV
ncbi:MAG: 3-phosphoglycerate dehydrogenase, partial [Rhodobacteraceae bacterium]|nr:3-phosphoglycerate dehydrogenase [Paracoccaceae bacterium]